MDGWMDGWMGAYGCEVQDKNQLFATWSASSAGSKHNQRQIQNTKSNRSSSTSLIKQVLYRINVEQHCLCQHEV
jgi:hypothetical protein